MSFLVKTVFLLTSNRILLFFISDSEREYDYLDEKLVDGAATYITIYILIGAESNYRTRGFQFGDLQHVN